MATNELIDKLKYLIDRLGSFLADNDFPEKLYPDIRSEIAALESQAKEPSDEDIENESKTSLSIDCRGIELPKEIRDLNFEILQKGFIIGAKAMRDGKIKTQTKLKG